MLMQIENVKELKICLQGFCTERLNIQLDNKKKSDTIKWFLKVKSPLLLFGAPVKNNPIKIPSLKKKK